MSLTNQVADARDVMSSLSRNRSSAMYLMHQELARGHQAQRQEQGLRERRADALAAHQRWNRRACRAQRAAEQAELALTAL